jgi:hypothetical protein
MLVMREVRSGHQFAEDIDIDSAPSQVLMLSGIVLKDLLKKR